jgi:hypothetical protein
LPLRASEYARIVVSKYSKPKKDYGWYKDELRLEKEPKDYAKPKADYSKDLELGDTCGDPQAGPFKDAKCKKSVCVLVAPVMVDTNYKSVTGGSTENEDGEYQCVPTGCLMNMPKCNGDNMGGLNARRGSLNAPNLPYDGSVGGSVSFLIGPSEERFVAGFFGAFGRHK